MNTFLNFSAIFKLIILKLKADSYYIFIIWQLLILIEISLHKTSCFLYNSFASKTRKFKFVFQWNIYLDSTTSRLRFHSTGINMCASASCLPFNRDILAVIYYLFHMKLWDCHFSGPLALEKKKPNPLHKSSKLEILKSYTYQLSSSFTTGHL